jgi:Fe-Mn family superoxide dismutase
MKLLPPARLPYPTDALEPYMGEETVQLHFALTKGYVERANKLIRIKNRGKLTGNRRRLFETNGAKLHGLWWENLAPPGPGGRTPKIPRSVLQAFGGNARTFKHEVMAIGMAVEGSGWVALVLDKRRREADLIEVTDHEFNWTRYRPLLLIDVWEHAYLLDYGGDRKAYLQEIWKLINWYEVERRLSE